MSVDLIRRAHQALERKEESTALPTLLAAATATDDAELWHWAAVLYRSAGDSRAALSAFAKANNLQPNDPAIAKGLAFATTEAGLDSVSLFERALHLSASFETLEGYIGSLFAAGEGARALKTLRDILGMHPQWAQGHMQYAQLAAQTGRGDEATETVDAALAKHPTMADLHKVRIHVLSYSGHYEEAAEAASHAIRMTDNTALFQIDLATALSDVGDLSSASEAFENMGPPRDVGHAIAVARNAVRSGDVGLLTNISDQWMTGSAAHLFWPYASIAWRMNEDVRWKWLEGDERLIMTQDLVNIDAASIATSLRGLHKESGRFLNQSVREGTQTDGALFRRIDPNIQSLKSAVQSAVRTYVDQLPPIDATHPMLRHRRNRPIRFSGSWSVRLTGQGHHANHFHSQGWISAAAYFSVPATLPGEEGHLTLGEPDESLRSGLAPIRLVRPSMARLVLFPSMCWHGTRRFAAAGERLSVAFDVEMPN